MVEQCWEPGIDIESKDEYEKAICSLAEKLLSSNTPDQLAEKLAQHIIYLDQLERTTAVQNDAIATINSRYDLLSEKYQHIFLKNKIMQQDAATFAKDIAISVITAKQRHITKKRMQGGLDQINERKAAVQAVAQSIAAELWQSDSEKKIRIREMADKVYRSLVDKGFTDVLPESEARVRKWIQPVAPSYARMGGRSSK